jgi:hypothetical protein
VIHANRIHWYVCATGVTVHKTAKQVHATGLKPNAQAFLARQTCQASKLAAAGWEQARTPRAGEPWPGLGLGLWMPGLGLGLGAPTPRAGERSWPGHAPHVPGFGYKQPGLRPVGNEIKQPGSRLQRHLPRPRLHHVGAQGVSETRRLLFPRLVLALHIVQPGSGGRVHQVHDQSHLGRQREDVRVEGSIGYGGSPTAKPSAKVFEAVLSIVTH